MSTVDYTKMITDRDVNALRSCAQWLETRSKMFHFAVYGSLMADYAHRLQNVADKLDAIKVAHPVAIDELFGAPAIKWKCLVCGSTTEGTHYDGCKNSESNFAKLP